MAKSIQFKENNENIYPIAKTEQSYSESTNSSYSADYINKEFKFSNYEITDTPQHSAGSNNYYISANKKIAHLVMAPMWFNSISANTWLNIGNIDASISPKSNVAAPVIIQQDSNGNIVSHGVVSVQTNGVIRMKIADARSSLSMANCSMSWRL